MHPELGEGTVNFSPIDITISAARDLPDVAGCLACDRDPAGELNVTPPEASESVDRYNASAGHSSGEED